MSENQTSRDEVTDWATNDFKCNKTSDAECAEIRRFDLNNAVHNSLTSNSKDCRYYNIETPFPISEQRKQLHVNIRSIYKTLKY